MKTLVCTLLINKGRADEVNKLVSSFKEHTDFDIVVYTDQPNEDIKHDFVVQMADIGDYRIKVQAAFNFQLKGIVIQHAYRDYPQYDRIIWADCDVFITSSHRFEKMVETDMYVRGGPFPPQNQAFDKLKTIAKFIAFRPLPEPKDLLYINEVLMVFNRSPRTTLFLNKWFNLCVHSTMNWGINPCYESVEFAIAAYQTPDLTHTDFPKFHVTKDTPVPTIFTAHRDKDLIYM
jgi:hypothetical protein